MIHIFYGTRPEYIKLKPVINALAVEQIPFRVIKIGQHTDLLWDDKFDYSVKIADSDQNRLNSLFSQVLRLDDDLFLCDYVMVHGDTTTAVAVALNGFHRQIPVMHVEAGLRTHAFHPYPEEVNRSLISSMAKIHFCPTRWDMMNLENEGTLGDIYVTGNTVIDAIKEAGWESTPSNDHIIWITLHRRENHSILPKWIEQVNKIVDYWEQDNNDQFKFLSHPNPAVQAALPLLSSKIEVVQPMAYDDWMGWLRKANLVITDSGGLQEECSYYGIPIIVCRKDSERSSSNIHLCRDPKDMMDVFKWVMEGRGYIPEYNNEFGDGTASTQIAKIIKERYNVHTRF